MKRLLVLISLAVSLLIPAGQALAAYDPLAAACAVNNSTSACQRTPEPVSGSGGVLAKATKLIALLSGIVAVILIVISGIFFVTANGEASKIASARSTLIGAIVGLIIVAAAQAILTFVLTKV